MKIKTEPSCENEGEKTKDPKPSLRRSSRTHKGNKWAIIKPYLIKVKKESNEQRLEAEPRCTKKKSNGKHCSSLTDVSEIKNDDKRDVDKVKPGGGYLNSANCQLKSNGSSSSTDTADPESNDSDDSDDVIREHSYAAKKSFPLARCESIGLSVKNPRLKSHTAEMAFYRAHLDHTYSCVSTINNLEAIKMRCDYNRSSRLPEHIYGIKFPHGPMVMSSVTIEPAPIFLPPFKDTLPSHKRKVSINQLTTKRFKRISQETLQSFTLISSGISTPKVKIKSPTKSNLAFTKKTKKPVDSGMSSADYFLQRKKRRRNKTGWPNPMKKPLHNEEQTTNNSKNETSVKTATKIVKKKKNKEIASHKNKSSNETKRFKMRLRNNLKDIESTSSLYESIEEAVKKRRRNKKKAFEVTSSIVKKARFPRKATNSLQQKVTNTMKKNKSEEPSGNKMAKRIKKRVNSFLACTDAMGSPKSPNVKEDKNSPNDTVEEKGCDKNGLSGTDDELLPPAEGGPNSSKVQRPHRRSKRTIFRSSSRKSLSRQKSSNGEETGCTKTPEVEVAVKVETVVTKKNVQIEPNFVQRLKMSEKFEENEYLLSQESTISETQGKELSLTEKPLTDTIEVSGRNFIVQNCKSFPRGDGDSQDVSNNVESKSDNPLELGCSETFSNSRSSFPVSEELANNANNEEPITVAEKVDSSGDLSVGSKTEKNGVIISDKNYGTSSEEGCTIIKSGPVTVIEVSDDSGDSDWESYFNTENPLGNKRPMLNLNGKNAEKCARSKEQFKDICNSTSESTQKSIKDVSPWRQLEENRSEWLSDHGEENPLEDNYSVHDIRIASTHSINSSSAFKTLPSTEYSSSSEKYKVKKEALNNSRERKKKTYPKTNSKHISVTPAIHFQTDPVLVRIRDSPNILRKTKDNLKLQPEISHASIDVSQKLGEFDRTSNTNELPEPLDVDEESLDGSCEVSKNYLTKGVPYVAPDDIKKLYFRVQLRLGLIKPLPTHTVPSGRPPFPYSVIASMAIEKSSSKAVQIRGMTDFALANFPFYHTHKSKWKINLRIKVATCKYFRPIKINRNVFYTFNDDYRLENDPDNIEPNKLVLLLRSVKSEQSFVTVDEPFHPLDHLLENNSFSQYLHDEEVEERRDTEEEVNPLIPVCTYSDADSDYPEEEPTICAREHTTGKIQLDDDPLGMAHDPFEVTAKEPQPNNSSDCSTSKKVYPCRYHYCSRIFSNFEAALDHAIDHSETMKQCPICNFATPDCNQLLWHVNVHQ